MEKHISNIEKIPDFIKENLESIEIINNGTTIDITNGQSCLIKIDGVVLFGPNNKGDILEIKNFAKIEKATSHGYISCAEITGEFSNGYRFYIHSLNPSNMRLSLKSIF